VRRVLQDLATDLTEVTFEVVPREELTR
jgi:hypothetical protein